MSTVISLTTIPSRIEHIEGCIDALLSQGLPVYLWAQKTNIVTGDVLKRIPPFLDGKPGLTVTEVNARGPITKLLPAFEAGHDQVLTADDDHAYGPHWAEGLIAGQLAHPDSAVCYRGRVFDKSRSYNKSSIVKQEHRLVELITSVSGVIYRRAFFSDSIFEEWKQWKINDDIVISAHLRKRTVPMRTIPIPKGGYIKRLGTAHIDPLYALNVAGNKNDEGLAKVFW